MVNSIIVESSTELQNAEPVGRLSILSYGAGHMLNDITSACWFTYLLLFLTDIGLSPRYIFHLELHIFICFLLGFAPRSNALTLICICILVPSHGKKVSSYSGGRIVWLS